MTDPYVRTYTHRGRLSYIPDDRLDAVEDLRRLSGTWQPRRRRPNRIHIASDVTPDFTPIKRGFRAGPQHTGKLASTRDSAKRFLKSIIAPPNLVVPENNTATGPVVQRTASNRSVQSGEAVTTAGSESRPEGQQEQQEQRQSPPRNPTMRSTHGRNHSVGGPVSGMVVRPSLAEHVRAVSGVAAPNCYPANTPLGAMDEKPLASGNGISLSISTAEPVLYLQGFDQSEASGRNTAMLRGTLTLRVHKPVKIKAVTLKFKGQATTKWPEGIPPKKTEFEEIDKIMNHTWPFFNAQFPQAEKGTGADHVQMQGQGPHNSFQTRGSTDSSPMNSSLNLSTKDQKKLSLQVNQARSFNKGETNGPSVAQKGYRVFNPGVYGYNFELPIDSRLPETIDVDLGNVKYELEAIVERAGAFKANLVGNKEVVMIRAPSEGSLEQVEPIAISRNWEDQLHYEIVISGKSFPLGAQVPIAFKLTPLAKVQCHRIKVFVTENVEYFCHNKRVHRLEPTRKVQLFEKRADGPSTSAYSGSSMRVLSGGGIPYDSRDAAAQGEEISTGTNNLLGDLDGNVNVGPTEMEFSIQLPSCVNTSSNPKAPKLHFDTTYQNVQVHHWIKIVMRLSKLDPNDPTRRRHFEISIDSPFHILSCRATQANTALPAYTSPNVAPPTPGSRLFECGCPGAAPIRRNSPRGFVPTLQTVTRPERANSDSSVVSPGLARPSAAHIYGANGSDPNNRAARPIHLLRTPSFNPPPFEHEEPPPPLETPPPQYDTIASPTSGLADYFARLSDAYDDDSEGETSSSRSSRTRVEIPLTPGGRVASRSMDETRTWQPVGN